MRGTVPNIRGAQYSERQPECGRASQGRAVRGFRGTHGPKFSAAVPDGSAQRYADAAMRAPNPMRKALLHERAARCFMEDGELDKSLHHAHEAHAHFKGIHPEQAEKFKDRLSRMLRSNPVGVVSVEFFDLG